MNLKKTFEFISGAKVATECFDKSRSWLHQRINGDLVHGKPVDFTAEQRRQLADYLRLKGQELIDTANLLEQ